MSLSKSDYRLARTCLTKLYYRKYGYPTNTAGDEYRELLIEGGYMVEATARVLHPGGIVVDDTIGPSFNIADAAATTRALLQRDDVTLFGATFLAGELQSRADIVRKRGHVLELVEVKAKSFDANEQAMRIAKDGRSAFRNKTKPFGVSAGWLETIEDVAFQVEVMQRAFPDYEIRPSLMLVDKHATTSIEGLHQQFEITKRSDANGRSLVGQVRFVGNADALRQSHMLTEIPIADEVAIVIDDVRAAIEECLSVLHAFPKRIETPLHADCRKCEYKVTAPAIGAASPPDNRSGFAECWGDLAQPIPHVLELYKVGGTQVSGSPLVPHLVQLQRVGLYDIPVDQLRKKDGTVGSVAARQIVQIEHTRKNIPWIGGGLASVVQNAVYPLHFIDFETSSLAVPYHARMRPYESVAFQWSCHTIAAPNAPPVHSEWINLEDAWPNVQFARALRGQIGDHGTVLMWSPHEKTTLNAIAAQMLAYGVDDDALKTWIEQLTGSNGTPSRMLDMHLVCASEFFHPGMAGRTSIKNVLNALWRTQPELQSTCAALFGWDASRDLTQFAGPYEALEALEIDGEDEEVREGTGAMIAYQSMLYGADRGDAHAKSKWRDLLLQYCKLDTLAMVLIWEHWRTITRQTP